MQQITENPYLQYFIGLPGYQETPPFDASTLVLFRKRISAKMLMEANEYLLQENNPDKKEEDNDHHNPPSGNGSDDSGKTEEIDNKVHKVENRIVSISQSWIRPIVRGKVKAPVEFGAKLNLSIDAKGYARIENISFDAYNESTCLQDAVNAYYGRTGYYPERVLADQIYRTRDNLAFCQKHGIRLSGPKLGRPSKETTKTDKQIEYQDNTDRIEVERRFSLTKRCYGMGKSILSYSPLFGGSEGENL